MPTPSPEITASPIPLDAWPLPVVSPITDIAVLLPGLIGLVVLVLGIVVALGMLRSIRRWWSVS
jgi:hypothetical protein